MSDGTSSRQWVGVDLHLHRSVICRIDGQGRQVDCVRIDNDPTVLVAEVVEAGRGAPVAIQATYGWYWAVDALLAAKCEVHLAHPYGMKAMRKRKRVKTDGRDAYELANLLRLGSLPEAYIAPAALRELRELRELVRHRRQLVKTATSVRNGIRGLLAKHGRRLGVSDLDAATGRGLLDLVELPAASALRLASQRRLLMLLTSEIDALDVEIDRRLKSHAGYRKLQHVKGIGPVLAAVFVVEIGDMSRFGTPAQLACWAGLTPTTRRKRPQRAPRAHQQGRQHAGAVGGDRGDSAAVRTAGAGGQEQRARPAREDRPQHRQGRRGAPHARRRVLRPARRARPAAHRTGSVLELRGMSPATSVTRTG